MLPQWHMLHCCPMTVEHIMVKWHVRVHIFTVTFFQNVYNNFIPLKKIMMLSKMLNSCVSSTFSAMFRWVLFSGMLTIHTLFAIIVRSYHRTCKSVSNLLIFSLSSIWTTPGTTSPNSADMPLKRQKTNEPVSSEFRTTKYEVYIIRYQIRKCCVNNAQRKTK